MRTAPYLRHKWNPGFWSLKVHCYQDKVPEGSRHSVRCYKILPNSNDRYYIWEYWCRNDEMIPVTGLVAILDESRGREYWIHKCYEYAYPRFSLHGVLDFLSSFNLWKMIENLKFRIQLKNRWINGIGFTLEPPVQLQDLIEECGLVWSVQIAVDLWNHAKNPSTPLKE